MEFGFLEIAFAEPIKGATAAIFNIPNLDYLTQDEKLKQIAYWGKSPKEILQLVGTKMREIDPDIWIKSAFHQAKLRFNKCIFEAKRTGYDELIKRGIVFSDVRYLNEAKTIKNAGGILIRINRPGFTYSSDATWQNHSSETELDSYTEWDYIIENNGTIEELNSKIRSLMFNIIKQFEGKVNV